MVLPHVALDWLWHCLFVFSWFFLMFHWIDCDIVYLWSHGPSSLCIGLIVTLFISILIGLPQVALDSLLHCLSVFLLFFLMLHWIDCDSIYLCSYGSSYCIGLIVTLSICVLNFMLHWVDCGIVYLCSHGSPSCCMGLIVTLFICVPMFLPHFALDWLWCWLSVFSWFFSMLHWIDCGIVCLCSHSSSSYRFVLIVTVFIRVLMCLPFLHWIDCDIVYLCSYGSSSCCMGLIVTLFVFVLVVLPHVVLDWLWVCFSVFLWIFLICLGLIVTLFICVPMVLPHVALYW